MDRVFRLGVVLGFFIAFSVEALLCLIVFSALGWEDIKAWFKKIRNLP